jgi:hypothetical protein
MIIFAILGVGIYGLGLCAIGVLLHIQNEENKHLRPKLLMNNIDIILKSNTFFAKYERPQTAQTN